MDHLPWLCVPWSSQLSIHSRYVCSAYVSQLHTGWTFICSDLYFSTTDHQFCSKSKIPRYKWQQIPHLLARAVGNAGCNSYNLIIIKLCVFVSIPNSCSSTGPVCTVLDISMVWARQKVVVALRSSILCCHFPTFLHSKFSVLLTHTLFFAGVLGNESSLIKSAAGLPLPWVCSSLWTVIYSRRILFAVQG